MLSKKLHKLKLIEIPRFLKTSVQYEVITGSVAYGVSTDTSDIDVLGFCIPDRSDVFPYSEGNIVGFGDPPNPFNQYTQHHIYNSNDKSTYDLTIYSIIKFF